MSYDGTILHLRLPKEIQLFFFFRKKEMKNFMNKKKKKKPIISSFLKQLIQLSFSCGVEACKTMVPVSLLDIKKTFFAPIPILFILIYYLFQNY